MTKDWTDVGTGDFNGDGKSDILWRNTDGRVAIWLMNGIDREGGYGDPTVADDWTIVGTGDFNGDGKSDILWRNIDGRVAVWLMNGMTAKSAAVVSTVTADWTLANGVGGTTFSNMVTFPSDVTLNAYPQVYQNVAASTVTLPDPYCALTSTSVSYPASYLGAFPLPSVQGAPLPASVRRGAMTHDVGMSGIGLTDATQNWNFGCRGDMHTAVLSTLARLKKLGADHIMVFRDTQLADVNATQLQILPWASFSIPDTEDNAIAAQAQAIGLQVWEFRQLVQQDSNNLQLPSAPTLAWASTFLDAYTQFVVDRAKLAQQNGIEAFVLDWAGYQGVTGWNNGSMTSPDMSALFMSKMKVAAQQVRSVYSGKIIFNAQENHLLTYDPDFMKNVELDDI